MDLAAIFDIYKQTYIWSSGFETVQEMFEIHFTCQMLHTQILGSGLNIDNEKAYFTRNPFFQFCFHVRTKPRINGGAEARNQNVLF